MKVEMFNPVFHHGDVSNNIDWPAAPRTYDGQAGARSIEYGMQQMEAAHQAGFDSLNVAEHHYSTSQMSPAPTLFAAAAAQRVPGARIGVLGSDLPLHNPLDIAEQYAVLDNITGGRLTSGLLRGTPNEYLTWGTNPWESRERFEEAVELTIRAVTEPEPFGWEGRYYRFRNVALFPSPVQRPHPPLLLSGNSPSSARFAGRMRCNLGLSFMTPDRAAASLTAYREGAAEVGFEPTADNILYRQFAWIGETDDAAIAETTAATWPLGTGLMTSHNPELMATIGLAGAALAGLPQGTPVDLSKAPPPFFGAPFLGSPETVLRQIRDAHTQIGMGRVELVLAGSAGTVGHEQVMRCIERAGQTIIPALHADDVVLAA